MNKFILTLTGPDRLGIIAKITSFLAQRHGFILEQAQFGDLSTGKFFMRCVFECDEGMFDRPSFEKEFKTVAEALDMQWRLFGADEKPRTVILVSKEAHCLNDLLHRVRHNAFPIQVTDIISNHLNLGKMAEWYGVPFHHLPISPETKHIQENQIAALGKNADLIILARYMQILSPELIRSLYGKTINIHHSFLPSFKGAQPYHQAFKRGVKLVGATVHFVNDELDEGPIIDQEVIRVDHTHSVSDLIALGRDIEAFVLAKAVKHIAERRVFLNDMKTVILK